MFDQLSLREKIMIIVGVIVLAIALYYFYLYLPLTEEISGLEQSLVQKEDRIKAIQKSMKDFPDLKEKYEKLSNRSKSVMDKELDKEIAKKEYEISSSGILKYFNSITEKSEVRMNSFVPKEMGDQVELAATYNGDFYELIDFFDRIDKFQPDIGYSSLSLNNQRDSLKTRIKLIFPKGGSGDE